MLAIWPEAHSLPLLFAPLRLKVRTEQRTSPILAAAIADGWRATNSFDEPSDSWLDFISFIAFESSPVHPSSMRRGSQRGRGRNPNPARSASARRNASNPPPSSSSRVRSTSRGATLQRSGSHASLRRSARLAELLNGETNQQVNGATTSMADVARSRPLGSNSVRTRAHARNSGRSRSGHHYLSPEDIRYAMDIVVQPPRSARAGQALPGSIVVRLRTTNADPEDAVADSANLVAVAALIPGNSAAPADPNVLNAILIGRRFDSIHSFADDEADGSIASMDMADPQGVGYMRFPDLIIRQAGAYRIRVTLIRLRNSASDPPVASAGNGAAVQIVDSNIITVMGAGPASNMAAYNGEGNSTDDGGWLEVLRTIQDRRTSR
ncbi:hypothetical protein SNOG_14855 [Parastagonospora nodorum SN15]|uniref:Velvet domain-containing protein n=2 Tax=Phaeosphaeria nodorum (strain SN15 / ATCC MYA-4574 / FGSC 10173) TaxID=321614 RepID=Q0U006_PHANO|nr:hypothetical protein SNOG_14855 [Parastagonospora nodorum SN15]EAT77707.1 hypothetical protein SNOG_14855 [Parastagonospora nodorum SN15]